MKRFRRSMQKMERQRMNNKGRCVAWWGRGIAGGGIEDFAVTQEFDPKKSKSKFLIGRRRRNSENSKPDRRVQVPEVFFCIFCVHCPIISEPILSQN